LARAVSRFGDYQAPIVLTDSMRGLVDRVSDLTGVGFDPADPQRFISQFGGMARMLGAALQNVANPTMLDAGYKANVIPSRAEAIIDTRFLPGFEKEWIETVQELAGDDVEIEWLHRDIAVETTFDGAIVDAMCTALKAEDPDGVPVPYLMSAGTDAKSFSTLGIRCFGFSPLLLPPELDFTALFHGIDERVPINSLQFGCRVLKRFLTAS
jgi:acetylornithine deacetylase/succinyl-diaminopimelate desuccinylase-like protein